MMAFPAHLYTLYQVKYCRVPRDSWSPLRLFGSGGTQLNANFSMELQCAADISLPKEVPRVSRVAKLGGSQDRY